MVEPPMTKSGKWRVQRLNGKIWFESRKKEAGTDFFFTIPVRTEGAAT